MELRQLEYFVAVAEEASFTRAAARLYVSQPGVSAQIRRLEQELGEELLDRSGRTVRLTEVGAAVLPYARAALDGAAGVRLAVEELTGLVRGRVSVGAVRGCSGLDLPGLLTGFHRSHSAVEITLSEDDSDRLLARLGSGHLDTAVVALAGAAPPGIAVHTFVDEPLVIAVHRGDPLAAHRAAAIGVLRDRPLISLPRGTGMRTSLDEACAAAGFEARVAFEAGDPATLAELAIRGLGPAILPASLAAAYPEEIHAVAVGPPGLRGRMALAWRCEGPISPAARAFVRHARAVLDASARPRAADGGGAGP